MKCTIQPDCLYLVTDSDLLHKGAESLEAHVEKAIQGGVDVVQLREKEADTGDFIEKAKKLLTVCKKYEVPFVVNDRVDVALAVGADGLHIGQDDMNCAEARKILGPDVMIGVSVSNLEEAKRAVEDGADYVGIGTVYFTQTKTLKKPTMGTSGVREIMAYLSTVRDRDIGTVAIGGINASNVERVMFASSVPGEKRLDGVALVSAIMTSSDPTGTARGLKGLMTSTPAFLRPQRQTSLQSVSDLPGLLVCLATKIRDTRPLIQHMTNNVVKNFSANVTIAVGASPAMSEYRDEVSDFAAANGAFLFNMGMVGASETPTFAVQENNRLGKPCLFDPVAAGATNFRRATVRHFLDHGYWDVVKGNEGEIRAASGLASDMKGVDNVTSSTVSDRCQLARDLARRLRNVVVVTGVEDVVSDGTSTVIVRSGHALLGEVTGSGCSLGSTIASAVASSPDDKFSASVAAVVLYGVAAEHAARQDSVKGPGTFIPAFIDALFAMSQKDGPLLKEIQSRPSLLEFV